jgi:putative ABC transport system permease protein
MTTLLQDLRYGLRILAKNPGFTAVAVLTLALGIGANAAIFSMLNAVMLRFLPVENPQELVQVRIRTPHSGNDPRTTFTNTLWEQVRDRQDVFSGAFAWGSTRFDLAAGGAVHYADGLWVSGDFFRTLGVRPATGRLFAVADDQRGCPGAAVLSYGFWQEHFAGAKSVVGSTILLNNHSIPIVGVTAPGFYGVEVGGKFDVALPICATALFDEKQERLVERSWWWLNVIGRVKPEFSPEQVKARLQVLSPRILAESVPPAWDPQMQSDFLKWVFVTSPAATGSSYLRSRFEQPLYILMGLVGLVLLIACANIASLMLARAVTRSREIAVRRALGASRMRLIRQLLTECLLLSSAGTLLGILFAQWGIALLVRYISTAENKVFLDFSPDARVLGFTGAMAVLTALLFGLFPAFRATRVSLTAAMKGSQAVEGERRVRFRFGRWIVASQVALSLVLLVAAGLFLRSFVKLLVLDIGFDRNNVLLVGVNLKAPNMTVAQQLAVDQEIELRLRSLPGVVSLGRFFVTPISGAEWNEWLHAESPTAPTGGASLAYLNAISPGYFETLRIPLLTGRDFNKQDGKGAPRVAIVNQTLARKFYANLDPLGRTFRLDEAPGKAGPPIQIVGVVKDSKYESLREDTYPTAFFPINQGPDIQVGGNFALRTAVRPSALARSVENAVAGVDKASSVEFHTLAEQVADSLVQERLLALLSGFFGALALLLAMIGLYGTLSYLVTQRQPEFGLRMALGAQRSSILWLVMRDVAAILAGGVVVGLSLSLATVRLFQKLLFGLDARDSVTLTLATVVLCVVVILAGYIPARRAMKVDPMVALRYE